jgi:hypothetical protein
LRKSFELRLRQEAMAMLNGSQIVEDHVASRLKRRPTLMKCPFGARKPWACRLSRIGSSVRPDLHTE